MLSRLWRHPERNAYLLATLCGLIAEGGVALALYVNEGAHGLALLFFVEAVILGIVFGPGPGIVGSVAPLVVYFLGEWARRVFDIGEEPTDTLLLVFVTVLYVAMLQAFFSGMAGAIRNRYFRDA